MKLVAFMLVGSLFAGGCAMQTGDPGTDDTVRSDTAADPGGGELGTAPKADPVEREGVTVQAQGVELPAAAEEGSGKTSETISAPSWQNAGNLAPQATKPTNCTGNQQGCEEPVPVPWQASATADVDVNLGNSLGSN